MKIAKTWFIVCLLLASMVIGIIPLTKAENQDSFGYTYKDSNTPGGPTYNWIEISDTGNEVPPHSFSYWWQMNQASEVNIGFSFEYYGVFYDKIGVYNGGLLALGQFYPGFYENGPGTYNPANITKMNSNAGLIAPYWGHPWTRIDFQNGVALNSVYFQTFGLAPDRTFVVEWFGEGGDTNDDNSGVTFEVILEENSNGIQFQYKDVELMPSYLENNGGMATIGIQDPSGIMGLEYSYYQPIIDDELAILFSYPAVASDANIFVSINAPASIGKGETMTYDLFYGNLGSSVASSVMLDAALSPDVIFVDASDEGIYNSTTRIVTWNIGAVAEYPSFTDGSRTVTVQIPGNSQDNSEILTSANIISITPEISYDDNFATARTIVLPPAPPTYISVDGATGVVSGPSNVYWGTPTAFQYQDLTATGVDIVMHIDDGLPDIVGSMTGPAPTWTYTVTFCNLNPPRHNEAVVEYIVHHPQQPEQTVAFSIYIDPAGYIYDANTLERISGATVWLQTSNGRGGWTNVPIGEEKMLPDQNPLITGEDGWYKWDTLPGTYRVHVEAQGYYPADSIAVTVPPPVTDLHVGLIPLTDDPPPVTTLYIGTPKQIDTSGKTQVTSSTSFTLTAQDNYGGSGVASTTYRVSNPQYSSGWISTSPPTVFHLNGLADGDYTIEYFSTDFNGNTESTKTVDITLVSAQTITSLGPAKIWVGLKNSDDVGIKFDLKAEVYINGVLIGSGQLNGVLAGSSGFNNAKLNSIPITLTGNAQVFPGDSLTLRLYERNAAIGSGKNSGTARLWYNDAQANSQLQLTTGFTHSTQYLISGFSSGTSPGEGPKKTIDVAAGAKGSAFKLFGEWEIQIT